MVAGDGVGTCAGASHKIALMVRVALEEFLRTGDFGPFRIGMPIADVRAALGAPDEVARATRRPSRKPTCLKYGNIEFHADRPDGRLVLIHFDSFGVPRGGEALQLDPWFVASGVLPEAAAEALTARGVSFTTSAPEADGEVRMRTAGGVELLFARVRGGQPTLEAVSKSR